MKEIIVVIDPMCSWCWGFAPVLQELHENYAQRVPFSFLAGGLREKGDQEWNGEFRDYLRAHWNKVAEETGQQFSTALLEKASFEYDTEPACRALVSMRFLRPEIWMEYLHRLQEAFYIHAQDISDEEVLSHIASECGVNKEEFYDVLKSDVMKEQTLADKYRARSMGANAFPSIVLIDDEGHLCVLKGYRDFKTLQKFLEF